MSHHLLLCDADEVSGFELGAVHQLLQSIPGVYSLRQGDFVGSVLQGFFDFGGDTTIVELSEDTQRISLTGTGNAALQLALEIQGRSKRPLRAFDTSYTFDVPLDSVDSLAQFQQMVRGEGRAEGVRNHFTS
jgi:hypothetical protein